MKGTRWALVAVVAAVVVLLVPAVGQGKTEGWLGWSRSPGGRRVASYGFGTVDVGSSLSKWFRLGSARSTKSGNLEISLNGSAGFSITKDRCTGKNIGQKLSCWVRVAYAPRTAGTSNKATLTALGCCGLTASLSLVGHGHCSVSAPDHIYWMAYDDYVGTVNGVPASGGCVTTLAANCLAENHGLAVDGTHVYWGCWYGGTVKEAPVGGGTVTTLATGLFATSITVDGTHVYWAADDGTVGEVPIGGGPVTTLATGQNRPESVAVDGTHVYWVNEGDPLQSNGTVNEIPLGGGPVTTLASGQSDPVSVAVHDTHVYWVDSVGGTVNEVPLGGGSVTTLATGQSYPASVAVDGTHVYWANALDGTVKEIPLGGGPVTTLASGQDLPVSLAVDSAHVYWANHNEGTVNEIPVGGGPVTTLASSQDSPDFVAVGP